MTEPRHRVLAEFMGGCSPDPATRTIATTALVLSLWQVAGWRMTHRPPSLLLLNATESTPDPIDRMADTIASHRGRKGPAELMFRRTSTSGFGRPGAPNDPLGLK